MKAIRNILLCIPILLFLFHCIAEPQRYRDLKIQKGQLDLREFLSGRSQSSQTHDSSPLILLDGDWEFYWKELIEPGSFPEIPKGFLRVPSSWTSDKSESAELSEKGYGTYRVRLKMPPHARLFLKLETIGSSYRLFANGNLLLETGKVGTTKETSEPYYLSRVVRIPELSGDGNLELVLQVSNFYDRTGGIWNSIYLGSDEEILLLRSRSLAIDLFLAGSLCIMGLYHFGLFLLRKNESSSLIFGIFALNLSLRSILIEERYIYEMIPSLTWASGVRLEYLTFYLGIPTFLYFINTIFPGRIQKYFIHTLTVLVLILSLALFVLPDDRFSETLAPAQFLSILAILFVFIIMIHSLIRKKDGAKTFTVGVSLFSLFFINDILYGNQIIHTGNFSSFGLFLFIFSQAFFLSIRLTRAFNMTEKLSRNLVDKNDELERLKENLEIMVIDRTQALETSKREVEKLNELSKLINSSANLEDILKRVYEYVQENHNLNILWFTPVDEDKKRLYAYNWSSPLENPIREEKLKYLSSFDQPLDPSLGTLYYTYLSKEMLYISDVKNSVNSEKNIYINEFNGKKITGTRVDLKIILSGNLRSIVQIPLVLEDRVMGILSLSSYQKKIDLTRDELLGLGRLGEQIVGVILNSHLFEETRKAKENAEKEREKSEKLLLNILPKDVALELKEKGFTSPVHHPSVSVMFTDFKGFTKIAESMKPSELISELDRCFSYYDSVIERYHLEKLKTIGDSYMCAGGIPIPNQTHAIDCVLAALEIQSFMNQMKEIKMLQNFPYWELRLGIHSGPLVAGVIGDKKFAYDVWGDTVNTASRMESSGIVGKINISGSTYEKVKDFFQIEFRGKVSAKNKGEVDMYFVEGLLPEFSKEGEGRIPNEKFWKNYVLL
ncbi:MAG: hypothetical protein H7A24_05980 [Leptospiraceae bacterium]|nr:hypothetical protein [Leptospiraceae bacterium]